MAANIILNGDKFRLIYNPEFKYSNWIIIRSEDEIKMCGFGNEREAKAQFKKLEKDPNYR